VLEPSVLRQPSGSLVVGEPGEPGEPWCWFWGKHVADGGEDVVADEVVKVLTARRVTTRMVALTGQGVG
jgi:hypothetical protein